MNPLVISNISVYKAISEEAYLRMRELIDTGRSRKPDGSEGWVIKYDPEQKSFKQSMISIVFMGIWLEALLHLKIVSKFNVKKFKDYDHKTYEEKLKLLGFDDVDQLKMVEKFRKCRKALVHEKAHLDVDEMKVAQEEAENASNLLEAISKHFSSEQNEQ